MEKCTRKPLGKIILFSLAALLWTGKTTLTAQRITPRASCEKIKFEQVTVEDGISQGTIKCLLQDKQGYLWFGTESGLNRYDGYNFKTFQHDGEDSNSLSNNVVNAIYEEEPGVFWVGTNNGLNRFDSNKKLYSTVDQLMGVEILAIIEDLEHNLWVGTRKKGLFRMDMKSNECKPYLLPGIEGAEEIKINLIYVDDQGIPWLGSELGFFRYDKTTDTILSCPINGDIKDMKKPLEVKYILGDKGKLWVGTLNNGLLWYQKNTGVAKRFFFSSGTSNDNSIYNITAVLAPEPGNDGNDYLWLGTSGSGVIRFYISEGRFEHYVKQPGIRYSLSNNRIYSLYRDRAGVLWVGTENGLNKVNKRRQAFVHWTQEPGSNSGLKDQDVWAIWKDGQENIWVGTNEGLDKIDGKTGHASHYSPFKDGSSNKRIFALCQDYYGILWVGTWAEGLNRLDMKTGTFLPPFKHQPGNPTSLSSNGISALLIDKNGVLWVGTWKAGLNRFHRQSQSFTRFTCDKSKPGSLSNNAVTCIYQEPSGVLWVGTSDGLNRFNPENESFTVYRHDPDKKKSLGSGAIYAICRDRKGTLWVGTADEGLNKLIDQDKVRFKRFRKRKEGSGDDQSQYLPSDIINGILEDEKGFLWLSTNRGLTRFNPETETCTNYNERDGLQSAEFHGGSFFKRKGDKQMFFGGGNGLNAFFPSRIKENKIKPILVVSKIQVNYEPIPLGEQESNGKMELNFHDSISFEFTALDFTIPEKNKYRYRLEPIDEKWSPARSNNRFANYNQLPPGRYIFKAMGSNNDGLWSDETAIPFRVMPPFYLTWWFLSIAAFLVALAVFAIYRIRTGWLREKLDEQERVGKILKQSRDEMEAARNLAEFRHAEIEILLTAISAILIAVDSGGLIFQWNQPSTDFFKIPEEQALKRTFADVLKDSISKNQLNTIMKNGLSHDTITKEIEIQVNFGSPGKSMKLLLASVSPIMDRDGKQLGFLLLAEDITNRKEEEMMSSLSKKLEALGQMASGIAHEIKTPLQYIGHNARFVGDSFNDVVKVLQLVEEVMPIVEASGNKDIASRINKRMREYDMDYVVDEVPKASEQIINGVGKVSEIIQSMTEYSYPGRGFKEKCDINEIIRSTLVVVQNSIKKKADIELELYERLPHIPCYPGELSQVFLNMLVNAVDAIDESGKWGSIKISTSLDRGDVIIAISDTGAGIPDNYRDNIFNPFFTTKRVGKGTGQGLSLAHNVIIDKHGGKLDFSSKVGKGTSFYIRLPIDLEGEH